MSARRGLAAVAVAAAVGALASSATAGVASGRWSVRLGFAPQHVFQGKRAAITVFVRSPRNRCSLAVHYLDGTRQAGLPKLRPVRGRIRWTWTVATSVQAGAAKAVVLCDTGILIKRFVVVGSTAVPSKLQVVAQGWSQRPDRVGPDSSVSFGVQLRNPSAGLDAKQVTVLVNAVDAADRLLASTTSRIAEIAADSVFNLGGSLRLGSQTQVARLEVVVQTQEHVPHELHQPLAENVRIVPSRFESDWVGDVEGEVLNNQLTATLSSAQLSIVLLDSTGKVVGGGTGFVLAKLPPGTRAFFTASSGLSAVPMTEATTALVSFQPQYTAPGA